ncbi:phage portal protein [Microbacterium sp. SMR1]|uniref:phage portal protein n=1 Tax=Microbacterium sp. SMR1 TaxID=1497340 RepID=UPI000DCC2B74|nr:phage portal protein [Microbacterium sp. SMR1]RAZ34830.1 phage portal protein [Microbacterium sp. SMR1]
MEYVALAIWDTWKTVTRAAEVIADGGAFVIPSREVSSRAVSSEDALTLPEVYRAFSLISTAIKQLSLDVYRGDERLDPKPAIVRAPNVDMSVGEFLELVTNSLTAQGNAYLLIDRDSSGRVVNFTPLDPRTVEPDMNAFGTVTHYRVAGRTTPVPSRDMEHLKLNRMPGRAKGLGPIQAAQGTLRGALDVRDYASNWFHDSGLPAGGYWSTDKALVPAQAELNREALTRATRDREGAPMVGDGFKLVPFTLSPEDAQWLESRKYNTTDIARLFGVPASLMLAVLDGNAQSYQNVSQELTGWVKFGLAQYTTEIEEALSRALPRGQRVRFNFEALLRGDTAERYAAHESALRAGWMTPDEVRAIENLPPLPKPEPAPAPAPEVVEPEAPETEEAVNV